MFGPLKEETGGKKFCSDEEVQQAVHGWLHRQPQEFFFYSNPYILYMLEGLY
jgi:hypothetical protein